MLSVLRLMRPSQWFKNIFVLFPLLFSGLLWTAHAYAAVGLGFGAAVGFCCWSSAVYVFNDLCDIQKDRFHPRKRNRPIASGAVSIVMAICVGSGLAVVPFIVSGFLFVRFAQIADVLEGFSASIFLWYMVAGLAYLINSLLYDFIFRRQALLDVFSIALGFVFRILAGCGILGVTPSQWILVCTFSMALFLGFGKRRMEYALLSEKNVYRESLTLYPPGALDILLGVTATCCLMSYIMYTVSVETIAFHKTSLLVYTVPLVFYGIFRYLFNTVSGRYDGPVEAILSDRSLIGTLLLWLIIVLGIFAYVNFA